MLRVIRRSLAGLEDGQHTFRLWVGDEHEAVSRGQRLVRDELEEPRDLVAEMLETPRDDDPRVWPARERAVAIPALGSIEGQQDRSERVWLLRSLPDVEQRIPSARSRIQNERMNRPGNSLPSRRPSAVGVHALARERVDARKQNDKRSAAAERHVSGSAHSRGP